MTDEWRDWRHRPGFLFLFFGVTILGPGSAALALDGNWRVAALLASACVAALWLSWRLYRGKPQGLRHQR